MSRLRETQDSLELFLDTICNMFGGFIFIMLFVVVSLRTTTERVYEDVVTEERASVVELQELEIKLEELQRQWESVSERVEHARSVVEQLGSKEASLFQHETLDVLDELNESSEENASKSRRIAELERERLELDVEYKTATTELREAQKKLDAAHEDAESARKLATRKSSPPQMRSGYGFRTEIGVILKYGRLYFWHNYDGRVKTFNAADFHVVEEDSLSARTEPLPWRGIDLTSPGVSNRLDAAFSRFDPSLYTVAIVVASDSYEEYSIVRDFLKDRTFRIRPIIGEKGGLVADRGGSDAQTQ